MTNCCLSKDSNIRETFTDFQVKEIFDAVAKAVEEEISKQYCEIRTGFQSQKEMVERGFSAKK